MDTTTGKTTVPEHLPPGAKLSSGAYALKTTWPHLWRSCCEWFYGESEFGKTDSSGRNPAGYLYISAEHFRRELERRFPEWGLTSDEIDYLAGQEVEYHGLKHREFREPCKALGHCLVALVRERPEALKRNLMWYRNRADRDRSAAEERRQGGR